jgi:hypothetical protein
MVHYEGADPIRFAISKNADAAEGCIARTASEVGHQVRSVLGSPGERLFVTPGVAATRNHCALASRLASSAPADRQLIAA